MLESEAPFMMPNLQIKAITPWDGRHRTLFPGMIPLEDKWLLFYRESSSHGYDGDSALYVQTTRSKGMHFDPPALLYNEPGIDAHVCVVREMGNGRLGMVGSRHASTGYDKAPLFIYSDDGGTTWTSRILSGNSQIVGLTVGTLQLHKYPASVGGHDTNGYILYSSVTTQPGSPVVYLKTVDNGNTWTSGVAYTPVGETLSTQAVVRLGDTDRWVWLARREVANDTTYAFKSTDMINWTGPYDTGQPLKNNPHNALYWNGSVYWMACSRYTAGGGTPRPLGPIQDGLVHQWADADNLWDNNFETGWPGWSECASFYGCEGHPSFFTDYNGDTYAVFGFNRSTSNDATQIGLMGPTSIISDFSASNDYLRPLTVGDRSQSSGGDLVNYVGDMISMAASTYTTVFNKTGNIELLSGMAWGVAVGYRLTVDGRVVSNETAVIQAETSGGNRISFTDFPAAIAKKSMKLEVYNASNSSRNVAWRAKTREW